jgi:hypothetical protein
MDLGHLGQAVVADIRDTTETSMEMKPAAQLAEVSSPTNENYADSQSSPQFGSEFKRKLKV